MGLARVVLAGLGLVFALGTQIGPVARAQTATGQALTQAQAQAPKKNAEEADENDQYMKSPNVVALGAKMGLNPEQSSLAFRLTNFLLLAVGVIWVAAKILPKTLRERNVTIRRQLVDANVATEEARKRLSAVEERLAKLDGEIAGMRTRAEQDSVKEEERVRTSLEDERKKIVAAAEQEITAATMHAQKQLQQHAAELAIEQAARKLVISAETDRLLVQGFAQRLAGDEKKGEN
jgi:F-type H+-transporting ATPase subunit b